MRLFSGSCSFPSRARSPHLRLSGRTMGAAVAVVAALALTGCENTGTGGGRNTAGTAPLTGPGAPARVESPLPGEPGAAPPPAVVAAPNPALAPAAPTEDAQSLTLTPPPGMAQETRVAILLPLSGPRAALGQAVLDAAMLALFEVADGDFALRPYDTAGTADGAAAAAEKAIADGVKLVIGPVFSDAVRGAAPVIQAADLNMMAFSNNRDVAEPGVYLSGLLPETQINRVIGYAARRGIKRLGVLVPSGPFGGRALEAVRQAAANAGMELVRSREYGPSTDEIVQAVRIIGDYATRRAALLAQKKALVGREDEISKRALARLDILDTFGPVAFDALFVAASGSELVNMAAQLGNFDVDSKKVRILGLASWAAAGTGREPSLVGSWFAAPPAGSVREFDRNFRAMFESAPHPLGQTAYDLVALAAILGSQEGGAKFDRDTLTSESGFAGIGGLFRFLPDGTAERSLEVREVGPNESKIVDPARESFESLTN
jgi:branched-chain amino acid transport system substrate-binding protein